MMHTVSMHGSACIETTNRHRPPLLFAPGSML